MMKKSILFTGLTFALLACSPKASKEETVATSEKVEATAQDQAEASAVVKTYLELKDALVQSDAKLAQEKAAALAKAVDEGTEDYTAIRETAQEIVNTAELANQRKHFKTLSAALYEVLKAEEGLEAPLYKQYCPMANNNKGAFWLSAEKEIMNPYFGDMMLHCGSVQDELK
tara:strand:- start:6412 stop:6927 length:516 start_codon:yes stop_codon:yes gene_type:complete